ncbi:hypothetical protein MFIFM68171_09852 [Madurella fahalii]|uniref:SnoaL-like domain-containing protein n=1 Tax=Madurella fahalii TaxID=1157608 RepID=A0ABQ0GPI1_9PEZI
MKVPPPEVAELIRCKKSRYARFADTGKWDQFDTIFVPDATFCFVGADGKTVTTPDGTVPYTWQSREAWVAFFEKALADVQVMHHIGPGELEMVGPDEIKAVFQVVYHVGPKGYGGEPHETGGGHYFETWVRKGDDWLCKDLWMQRIYHKIVA